MSLHAELSPEARARLEAQRRNSTILSVVISILIIALLILILAFLAIKVFVNEPDTIVSYSASISDETRIEEKKLTHSVDRKPSAPSSSMARVIAANTSSPTAVPVPEVDVPDASLDFGNGDDFGAGWGSGDGGGSGGGFSTIPATMRKRCSKEDRLQRLRENGGTEACEAAVIKGLDWLKATQNADGSWNHKDESAMTGFAILAFLGHCETPLSAEYGDTVLRGITWLVNLGMKQDGVLTTGADGKRFPYQHAIATYALGESSTFCKQLKINVPNLFEVTQQAGQYIINNQNANGGWAYDYATSKGHIDLSVAAWQIQALKACDHTGLDFKNMKSSISNALEYVAGLQNENGGFGYGNSKHPAGKKSYFSLTGAGMLAFQMWDNASAPEVRNGAKYIRDNSKFDYKTPDGSDLYAHYYESQAMIARGGDDWKFYNNMFRDPLLAAQQADGSFASPPGALHGAGEIHYRTCLCILMLETYYRFLPGTGGGH